MQNIVTHLANCSDLPIIIIVCIFDKSLLEFQNVSLSWISTAITQQQQFADINKNLLGITPHFQTRQYNLTFYTLLYTNHLSITIYIYWAAMTSYRYFKLNTILTIVTGALPLEPGDDHKFLRRLFNLYRKTVLVSFTLFVATEWVEFYRIPSSDVRGKMENIGVSLLYSVGIVKLFVCSQSRASKLRHQVREIEDTIVYQERNVTHVKIFNDHLKHNNAVWIGFVGLGVITISVFFTTPVIISYTFHEYRDNLTDPLLPFSSWFPFDKYEHYALAYAIHVVAGLYGCSLIMCVDFLFYGLMILSTAQIKILQDHLRNFRETADNLMKDEALADEQKAIMKVLRKCAMKHQYIIR